VIRDIETCSSALIRLGSAKTEAGSQTDVLRIHLFLHVTALRLVMLPTCLIVVPPYSLPEYSKVRVCIL
jgi:hypothetical protein